MGRKKRLGRPKYPASASQGTRVGGTQSKVPAGRRGVFAILPLAALVTFGFVMGFHSLIGMWPAPSVVTMFYVLTACLLWFVRGWSLRLRRAR